MLDLKRLRYFCAIVEQGQISRAAKRLNIAQPAISRHLKELEDELGTPLILRHERKWQLTRAGEFLYEKAQQMLGTLDNLPAEIQGFDELPAPWLCVGVAPVCSSLASKTVSTLLKTHPGLRFRLYHGDVSVIEEWLDERLVDLALCRRPRDAAHYTALPLPPSRFSVVYPAALLPSHQNAHVSIDDLHKVPLLISKRRRPGGVYEELIRLFMKKGKGLNILVESMDVQTLVQLLDEGLLAAAILPDSEISPCTASRYQVKPLDEPALSLQAYLVHRKNMTMSGSVRAFIETLTGRSLPDITP